MCILSMNCVKKLCGNLGITLHTTIEYDNLKLAYRLIMKIKRDYV